MRNTRAIPFLCVALTLCLVRGTAAISPAWVSAIPYALGGLQSLFRSAFLSAYAWKIITVKTELANHFFKGLDEIKYCAIPPTPPAGLLHMLRMRTSPEYARNFHHGPRPHECAVGALRALGAAYFVVSDSIGAGISSSLTYVLGGSSDDQVSGFVLQRISGAVQKAFQYRSENLLPGK